MLKAARIITAVILGVGLAFAINQEREPPSGVDLLPPVIVTLLRKDDDPKQEGQRQTEEGREEYQG